LDGYQEDVLWSESLNERIEDEYRYQNHINDLSNELERANVSIANKNNFMMTINQETKEANEIPIQNELNKDDPN
jgi:ppGpp synthetase/RelA/SpoT-type nucleotidyltranferase